ncbi:MAG: long-chain-fatty-acid--CoA ligase [Chloroflexi bacterium]|nr:long-chain-fatty-acid--CoA ligase [Chloroflexota bacterium]
MNTAEFLSIANMIAPDKEAIVFEDTRLSYAELNARSNQLASRMQSWGVGSGDRVGIMQVNCNEVIETYFAAAKLGAIFVPLSFRGRAEEIRHMVNASESKVVITGSRYLGMVDELRPSLNTVEHYVSLEGTADGWEAYEDVLSGQPTDDITTEVDDDDTTILMFTAGTTGLPKGVMLTFGGVSSYSLSNVTPVEPDQVEKNILTVPLYHVAGMQAVISAIFGMRTLVIQRQFEAESWMKLVQDEKVSRAMMVPTMLKMLLDHEARPNYDLSSLDVLTYGAAPMPKEVIKRAIIELEDTQFINAFGQTEASATITALMPDDHNVKGLSEEEREKKFERLSSIGKPLPGVEIRIVDEDGTDVPTNEQGEIIASGPQLMKGYWQQDDVTAETIKNGWLFTGDLGYQDDEGYIFLTGRAKDFIKRAGEMISPEEVEQTLMSHPAVDEAAIIGIPDEQWGERVRAVVVLKSGQAASQDELIEYSRQRLASFKRPEHVVFSEEPLPRNPLGKVLKRDLKQMYTEPITDPA